MKIVSLEKYKKYAHGTFKINILIKILSSGNVLQP